MTQLTCKPLVPCNRNQQNGPSICYHFAVKRENEFSKSEYFQGFAASHVHFYLIPTRSRQAYSKQVCLWDLAQIICITFIIQVA